MAEKKEYLKVGDAVVPARGFDKHHTPTGYDPLVDFGVGIVVVATPPPVTDEDPNQVVEVYWNSLGRKTGPRIYNTLKKV